MELTELTEAEYECITWYRTLDDHERLAVQGYVHFGDRCLLPLPGEDRKRLDCLRRLMVAKRNNQIALFDT